MDTININRIHCFGWNGVNHPNNYLDPDYFVEFGRFPSKAKIKFDWLGDYFERLEASKAGEFILTGDLTIDNLLLVFPGARLRKGENGDVRKVSFLVDGESQSGDCPDVGGMSPLPQAD